MTISSRADNGQLFTARLEAGSIVEIYSGVGAAATRLGAAALQRLNPASREAVDAVLGRVMSLGAA